jgi:hypothetical protein
MNSFEDNLRLAFTRQIWANFYSEWGNLFSSKIEIFSARSSGEHKKVSTYDKLKTLKDDPNIYISYIGSIPDMPKPIGNKQPRYHPKIGINPNSHYSTPLGIYTYPLREIWKSIESNDDLTSVPYQGNKPYIAVLRLKKDTKFIDDMYKDYDSSNYDEDKKRLREFFVPGVLTNEDFIRLEKKALESAKENNPVMSMWNLVRHLSYITVEFKKEDITHKEIIDDILSVNDLNDIMPNKRKGKLNPYGLAFNRILNGILKYDGFADKSGKGYIHNAEPMQAIFLNPTSFEVIEILNNDHSTESGKAVKNYNNKKRLNYLTKYKGFSLSEETWNTILLGHPSYWEDCPYEDIKNDPKILEIVDDHFSNKISKNNITSLSYPKGKEIEKLPKTKDTILKAWIEHIKVYPLEFEEADAWIKINKNFQEAHKEGWKNYLIKFPEHWKNCPYEDIKEIPELKEKALEYWKSTISRNAVIYNYAPEELKHDEELYTIAIAAAISYIDTSPDKWNDLDKSLRENATVIEFLKKSWKRYLNRCPTCLNKLPDILQNDPIYRQIAKNKVLELLSKYNVEDIYGKISNNIPFYLHTDSEIRQVVLNKWKEKLDIDPALLDNAPIDIQTDPSIFPIAIEKWKKVIISNPYRMHHMPDVYQEAKNDPDIWRKILMDYRFGYLYEQCPFDNIKQDPKIKESVREHWKNAIKEVPKYHNIIPEEFRDILQEPEVKDSYISYIREKSSVKPKEFDYEKFTMDEEREAYLEGINYYVINQKHDWDSIPEFLLQKLLKNPEIYKELKLYWIEYAKHVPEIKLANPFGYDLYKEPEIIESVKLYILGQLAKGIAPESIHSSIPELVQEVANDSNINEQYMEYWKRKINENPKTKDYLNSKLDPLYKQKLTDYAEKVLESELKKWRQYIYDNANDQEKWKWIHPRYIQHPELLAYMNEIRAQQNSQETKSTSNYQRTVWASVFNDNVIIKF